MSLSIKPTQAAINLTGCVIDPSLRLGIIETFKIPPIGRSLMLVGGISADQGSI